MAIRIRTTDGARRPPDAPAPGPVLDEGPMRRELLRQIAFLDAELSARDPGFSADGVHPRRGPAVLPTATLERIRDELLAALARR